MSEPRIIAWGHADSVGVAGSSGTRETWEGLGVRSLGTGRVYRELFGRQDDTYRRLDRQSKSVVLAVAATGIDQLLTPELREETALVTETVYGSLEVDLRYTHFLELGVAHGAIFPYTLQSTCLGDVALRHGLRGPTISLSIDPDERGEALAETRRMMALGELRCAVVGAVDALESPLEAGGEVLDARLGAAYAVLATDDVPAPTILDWPADGDLFRAVRELGAQEPD